MRIAVNYACGFLGMRQVTAEIAADNTVSMLMLSAVGFVERGRMKDWFRRGNQYIDGIIMQYLHDE